jgi:hypothetical protein
MIRLSLQASWSSSRRERASSEGIRTTSLRKYLSVVLQVHRRHFSKAIDPDLVVFTTRFTTFYLRKTMRVILGRVAANGPGNNITKARMECVLDPTYTKADLSKTTNLVARDLFYDPKLLI